MTRLAEVRFRRIVPHGIGNFPALQLAGLRHGFSTRSAGPLEKLETE